MLARTLLHPRGHFRALREVFGLLTRHRQLTWEMTKREISDRYTGQVIGVVWAVGHPVALMAVYIFIFAFVFKARMEGTGAGAGREMPLDYIAYLLSGLLPWMAFQDSMAKGARVIVANSSIVKQVVFPIEVLPVKGVLASMVAQVITTTLLLLYLVVSRVGLHASLLLLPVVLALQFLAMTGVSFWLSAVGVYFRDIKDFVQLTGLIGMYLMPISYMPEWVPETIRPIIYINPFSYMVWCFQDVIYFGRAQHPVAWVVFPAMSAATFYVGFRIFRKLKTQFGNVL